jgi:hypothetical protein
LPRRHEVSAIRAISALGRNFNQMDEMSIIEKPPVDDAALLPHGCGRRARRGAAKGRWIGDAWSGKGCRHKTKTATGCLFDPAAKSLRRLRLRDGTTSTAATDTDEETPSSPGTSY